MTFAVLLTEDAAGDLEELHTYISRHDSPAKAEYVLTRIEEALDSLSENPARGGLPRELSALGIREYRQIYFKPYRIIYRVDGDKVFVYLVVDGRRDMQTLLQRRLLCS